MSAISTRPRPLASARLSAPAWGQARRVARTHPQIVFGGLVMLAFVVVGAFAPLLAPYHYDQQNLANGLRPPLWVGGTLTHPLGTDEFGRDTLSRLIYGARISLVVGVFSVVLAGVVGVVIGLISGFAGGNLDAILMRIADVQYS